MDLLVQHKFMKKLLILIFLVLLSSSVFAWNWNNHKLIVDTVYYNIDINTQRNLNLTLIREGSIAPDKDFHDNVLHHYPPTYELSLKWLEAAKSNYSNGDFNKASYAFGVAAHYISDSFVAPHYISKEPYKLHSEFESVKYKPKTKCFYQNYNLDTRLKIASQNKDDWEKWLISKDSSIPERELEDTIRLLFPITLETFNTSCNTFQTNIIKNKLSLINTNMIIYLMILLAILLFYKSYKRFKV